MKLIYIAGPYTALTKEWIEVNILKAEEVGQQVLERGHIPIIPHKITGMWHEHRRFRDWAHKDWMEKFCLPLLSRCDAMLLMDNWRVSRGTRFEKLFAEEKGIEIFYSIFDIPSPVKDIT